MKKVTRHKILEKKQHLHILNTLAKHSPLGLSLQELTYLLTNKSNMNKMSLLQKNFGKNRNNVFKSRQRILDCLTDLIQLDMIYKRGKKYRLNILELKELILHISLYDQSEEMEEEQRERLKELKNYRNIFNDKKIDEFEEGFWKHNKRDFLEKYLTKE